MSIRTTVEEIPKITANFAEPAFVRVFKGGRGGGKTQAIARRSLLRVYQLSELGERGVFLCGREHLNSLDESSLAEIKAALASMPWLAGYFEVGEKFVRTANGRIQFVFAGLRHNLDSIKSKARILGAWIEEAENVSEAAWRKLIPTLRSEGPGWVCELWITYNPESPDSATHKRFVASPPDGCLVTEINYSDNPWFPDILDRARQEDQAKRPDIYDHVWEGAFLTLTEAQVFAGKYEMTDFEPDRLWDGPYFGLDFGFSQDPTAAVECYIGGRILYIRREAGRAKLELDDTATFLLDRMPLLAMHKVRADSARPESISYLARNGVPSIEGVKKWPGSVEDGVAFIKSFDRVIIHPECEQTAREFRLYSYKTDRLSGDIMPKIIDANNHYIDALRYALQPMIGGGSGEIFGVL